MGGIILKKILALFAMAVTLLCGGVLINSNIIAFAQGLNGEREFQTIYHNTFLNENGVPTLDGWINLVLNTGVAQGHDDSASARLSAFSAYPALRNFSLESNTKYRFSLYVRQDDAIQPETSAIALGVAWDYEMIFEYFDVQPGTEWQRVTLEFVTEDMYTSDAILFLTSRRDVDFLVDDIEIERFVEISN